MLSVLYMMQEQNTEYISMTLHEILNYQIPIRYDMREISEYIGEDYWIRQFYVHLWQYESYPAGTRRHIDVETTSNRYHDVDSTLFRRRYDVMCRLGNTDEYGALYSPYPIVFYAEKVRVKKELYSSYIRIHMWIFLTCFLQETRRRTL